MRYLPVFLDLGDRPALVVGGGPPAAAKARLLLKAGARVTVVAPALGHELAGLARRAEVRVLGRPFVPADVTGAAVVVGACGRPEVDAQVAAAARAQAIPVNVVDRADLSTFIVPAIVDRDPLVVAISSGGAAPALARRVRQSIEALLPARLGRLARFAESFRAALKANLPEAEGRRWFWERFFDGPVAKAVLDGDQQGAREAMLALVNRPAAAAERHGEVHLVTAAAGAPDLLSLRALRLLQRADLVVHDEPIDAALLDYLRRGAERLPLPAAGPDEREITALMARQARGGKLVVRLREGDPLALEPGIAVENAVAV